ncbi:hypothetical protein HPB50_008407 [Hyalomma asiaticum]|uniref:Uncharacterized protein n=1 Tax=Hyalomma asiaticum TaxID=266040 RepID=A0ACB7RNB4_HYAAI|nr:hypothetical protein HPB50_008407 [Hyalomma asiaticum]
MMSFRLACTWLGKLLFPVLEDPKVSFALTFRFLGRLGIAPVEGSIAGEAPGGRRRPSATPVLAAGFRRPEVPGVDRRAERGARGRGSRVPGSESRDATSRASPHSKWLLIAELLTLEEVFAEIRLNRPQSS